MSVTAEAPFQKEPLNIAGAELTSCVPPVATPPLKAMPDVLVEINPFALIAPVLIEPTVIIPLARALVIFKLCPAFAPATGTF